MTPASASLSAGEAQQFAAVGVMSDGTTAPVVATFAATGGTITPQGQYTAASGPGSYRVIAASGGFADTSSVTILGGTCSSTATRLCPGDNLQAKASAAGPGATLTLQAGVYRLQSINPLSGQTWQGDPGAILSGARVLTGWQSDGAGHWYVGGQTQQNTNFNSKYSCLTGHPGCYLPEQLWVDDVLYEHVTSLGSVGGGSWYFDYAADRIYLSTNPTGRSVETSVTVYAFGGSATGVTIRNLTIEKYANAAQVAAVNYGGGSAWTIESNEVRDNHGVGIGISANGVMRGNKVHHQGQMGIKAGGSNGLIEGNEIAYNNTAFFGAGHYAETGGSKFVNTNGLVVRNNFVHHNRGPGLWTDINNINCLYEGNRVEDNEWRGIFHEISFACVIRNNIVRRNGFNSPGASQIEGAGILISDSPDVAGVRQHGRGQQRGHHGRRRGPVGGPRLPLRHAQHPQPLGARQHHPAGRRRAGGGRGGLGHELGSLRRGRQQPLDPQHATRSAPAPSSSGRPTRPWPARSGSRPGRTPAAPGSERDPVPASCAGTGAGRVARSAGAPPRSSHAAAGAAGCRGSICPLPQG